MRWFRFREERADGSPPGTEAPQKSRWAFYVAVVVFWLAGVTLLAGLVTTAFDLNGGSPSAAVQQAGAGPDLGGAPAEAVATATPRPIGPLAVPPEGLRLVVAVSDPFIWPATGPISSTMGPDHPSGIDIALDFDSNQPIRAVADATVSFSGGSDAVDYGIHVILDHGNGLTTLYGHLSQRLVEEGERVSQGQVIGLGGNTGFADGYHLHLEVRYNGATLDPEAVLPADMPESGVRTTEVRFDCRTEPLVLTAGSKANINLVNALAAGERVVATRVLRDLLDAADVTAKVESGSRVELNSAVTFERRADREYALEMTFDNGAANRVVQCPVVVETRDVPPTFYARAPRGPAPPPTPTPDPRLLLPCHHAYAGGADTIIGGCIRKGMGDYDCLGVGGNAPNHVIGPVSIVGPDEYGLDYPKVDGIGCEG